MIFVIYHAGYRNVDFDRLDQIIDFNPGRSSTFTFKQYFQCYLTGKFASFESGDEYNLKNVTCPVTLWYSDKDWSVTKSDAVDIQSKISSKSKNLYQVPYKNFGHLDYLWDPRAHNGFYFYLISELVGGEKEEFLSELDEFPLRQEKQMLKV